MKRNLSLELLKTTLHLQRFSIWSNLYFLVPLQIWHSNLIILTYDLTDSTPEAFMYILFSDCHLHLSLAQIFTALTLSDSHTGKKYIFTVSHSRMQSSSSASLWQSIHSRFHRWRLQLWLYNIWIFRSVLQHNFFFIYVLISIREIVIQVLSWMNCISLIFWYDSPRLGHNPLLFTK